MRTASAGLKTWLAANNAGWRADLITLTAADGAVYRWTTADGDIAYGGNLFHTAGPFGPIIERSGYNNAARLVIDTLDMTLTGGGFQILGKPLPQQGVLGYFRGARIKIDHAIGDGPNQAISGTAGGVIDSFFEGRVAEVEPQGGSLLLRLKSELATLNQPVPRFLVLPQCGNAVYDPNCGLSKAAFTLAGAADGSPTKTSIHTSSAALTAKASSYFNLGVLKFTSGPNNGVARAVQNWDGATFTMQLPFPFTPGAGDTLVVYPGCDKSRSICTSRFANQAQYRGFPHVPAPEASDDPMNYLSNGIFGPFYSPHRDPDLTGGGSSYQAPPLRHPMVTPSTTATQGRPIPTAYGTVKVPLILIEGTPPIAQDARAWLDPSTYAPGIIVGADGGAWRCLRGGSTLANGRPTGQGSDPAAWVASHSYSTLGDVVQHFDAGGPEGSVFRIYQVIATGVSAGSGGPLGTGSSIKDGSVVWQYLGETPFPIVTTADGLIWQYIQPTPFTQYFLSLLGALCEGEITGARTLYWDQERYATPSLTSLGKGLQLRKGPDAANQVLTGAFDSSGYQHTALVEPVATGRSISTGTKKEVPSIALELFTVMFGVTTDDVNPADIVNDILTHSRRGAGWPSSRVGITITGTGAGDYRVYCDAAGFRFSLLNDTQRMSLDAIADILNATNSDAIWSQGQLKIVPMGDQAIPAPVYGATGYVPANTAQYNLSETDFEDPIQIRGRDDADCFNEFSVEYVDRSMGYQRNAVQDIDQTDVDRRGVSWKGGALSLPVVFPDGTAPIQLSRILAQRSLNVVNTYTFRVSERYLLLEPTDVLTISDATMGLSNLPVRIKSMREEADYSWTITAEDYPNGVAASGAYTPQPGDGYKPNTGGTASSSIPTVFGAGAITSTGFDNLWPNPTSELNPPASIPVPNNGSSPEWDFRSQVGLGAAKEGAWVRKLNGTQILTRTIPCAPGDIFQFLVWANSQTGGSAGGVFLAFYDASGTQLSLGGATAGSGWGQVGSSGAAPAGTVKAVAQIGNASGPAGDTWYDLILFRRCPANGPVPGLQTMTDVASIVVAGGDHVELKASALTSINVNAPIDQNAAMKGLRLSVKLKNLAVPASSVSWFFSSSWKVATSNTQTVATGLSRSIDFVYDGSNWVEISRTPTDVPN